MTDPSSPNFKKGTGRLVTDRFEFQDHIDGYGENLKHHAPSILLNPNLVIGTTVTNVQDALAALQNALTIPLVPDATTSSKGLVQLSGDIAGTATSVTVAAIRNFPIAATPPTLNQVLTWGGSSWAPAAVSASFSFSGDVTGSAGATTVVKINGKPVTDDLPNTNDGLVWNGSTWIPKRTVPNGTGFNHVTSGNIDTNATANIRYSGGKLQTDTNIQFKNSSITGDLAWSPTSSNKTLTLPNATDTLLGRATTDTLSNKTISATSNTITDSGTIVGDILISNGTKFVRQAKGSNGTFLGVSGGVLGYYTPAPSGVSGTGIVTITSGSFDANALAIGTSLQYLRVNSGGTALEWAAVSTAASTGSANAIQLSDGSGGFLANGTLGVASGGSLKLNVATAAIEFLVPIAGYATSSAAYRLQVATVNATTGSGSYTPTGTQAASPIWIVTAPSFDGYINLPAQTGAMYFVTNNSGNICKFRATGDVGTAAVVDDAKNAILVHNGTRYVVFMTT